AILGISMSQMITSKSNAWTSRSASVPLQAVVTTKLRDSSRDFRVSASASSSSTMRMLLISNSVDSPGGSEWVGADMGKYVEHHLSRCQRKTPRDPNSFSSRNSINSFAKLRQETTI